MVDFPKSYKQKISQKQDFTSQKSKKNNKSGILPLVYFPFPLAQSLTLPDISYLAMLDFFSLYYTGEGKNITTRPNSYYGSFASPLLSRNALLKQKKQSIALMKSLGFPWTFNQEYSTLSEDFSTRIKTIFSQLVSQKIIQESYQLVYRSTQYQTTLSGTDITFLPSKQKQYTVRYFVSTKNNSLDLRVDHPEFIFADVAIAIHPSHKKAKLLKGQEVIIPMINKKIPIIIDDRVDFAVHGGICRITPGHDQLSLSIAKDHNLPLDIYAVDENGKFTEHAGTFAKKSVKDFFDNIIQSLSDIGNLVEVQEQTALLPFCKATGEKMTPRSIKGRFIHPEAAVLESFFADPTIKDYQLGPANSLESYRCISSHYKNGLHLPVWLDTQGKSQIIDEHFLINKLPKPSHSSPSTLLGLLVFHLVSDGKLPVTFSVEQFVEILFSPGFTKDTSVLDSYLTLFVERYPAYQKEANLLQQLSANLGAKSKDNYETLIDTLITFLDKTPLLSCTKTGSYKLDLSLIDKSLSQQQSTLSFEYSFLNCILVLLGCGFFGSKEITPAILLFQESLSGQALKTTLLAYLIGHQMPWQKTLLIPSLISKTSYDPSSLIKTYTPDCIKLSLLLATDSGNEFELSHLEEIHNHISTFWNCCRYIKTALLTGSKHSFNLAVLESQLSKKITTFDAFDSWILSKTQSIVQDFQDISTPQKAGAFGHKLLQFIKHDFSSKYLELIKTGPSEVSHSISLFVVGILLKMLYVYIPTVSKDLRTLMGLEGSIEDILPSISFDGLQKNYLISLFMDIVDKFSLIKHSLNLKKHAGVSIFLQSNPDFLKFTKSNEHLLQKTLHAQEILYFTHHDKYPSGYKNEEIIDITIGLKAFTIASSTNSLQTLQKQLQQKEEYLQYVRSLLSNMNTSGADSESLKQKREEITQLKEEIDELSLKINKLKIKE